MTQPTGNIVNTVATGSASTTIFYDIFLPRDPTTYDTQYPVQKKWLNTETREYWILQNFTSANGVLQANWISISLGVSQLDSLTTQDSVVVPPTESGSIYVSGASGQFTTTGNASTNTVTINYTSPTTTPGDLEVTGSIITSDITTGTGDLNITTGGDNGNINLTPNGTGTIITSQITISDAPVNPTDGTNKYYVDLIAMGNVYKSPCYCASTGNFDATYNNGTSGVGATLTNAGAQAAFATDDVSPPMGSRVLIKDQTDLYENGIYTLTTVGTDDTNWVLTRSTDYDTYEQIVPGSLVPVEFGTVNDSTLWLEIATVETVGTDPIVFIQFGSTPIIVDQYASLAGGPNNTVVSVDAVSEPYPLVSAGESSYPTYSLLTVAGGGTGVDSLTSNEVLLGGSTVGSVSGVGTANQVLLSQGAGMPPIWGGPFAVNVIQFQSNNTYTPSEGMFQCIIECVGGGGGGGSATGQGSSPVRAAGGGGGAGGYTIGIYSASTIGASQSITIGSGGGSGSSGNTTSVGSLISSSGGGSGGSGGVVGAGGSGAGASGTGTLSVAGGDGCCGIGVFVGGTGSDAIGGTGGASYFGSGGAGGSAGNGSQTNGSNGQAFGSGGGGGASNVSNSTANGGNGARGVVLIREFIL